ncbi:alpha/beta hydrolase [Nocardia altamirensis]|uniref:alpha/beta hydrolase n=1 Tax=Nocardia altamirensis TaxID=472158 RepID=UPI001FDFC25C|nr:alpha/beta hydrolase [Nocardia altamirensis]
MRNNVSDLGEVVACCSVCKLISPHQKIERECRTGIPVFLRGEILVMRVSIRAIVVSFILLFAPAVAHADPAPPGGCTAVSFPQPLLGNLAATLCMPTTATNAVIVMMPGSNYNHTYWDFPYAPQTYSFRRAMNDAGYATLVVDRFGTGASSRPLSTLVTATASVVALHNLVGALRQGLAGSQPFGKVITAGHSLSSGIAVNEASAHHDVDGVLLTGFSHSLNLVGVTAVVATYQPAAADPKFAGKGYDPGYLTTRPGTRAFDFHGTGVDPQVIATDEATKDVFALTEYPDGLTSTVPPITNTINVPVMVVNGSQDRLCLNACATTAALQAAEAPFFSAAARLRTFVLPGSGHSVNLAPNTADYQAAVRDWLSSTVLH